MGQVSTGRWLCSGYKYCREQRGASIYHWPLVGGSRTARLFVRRGFLQATRSHLLSCCSCCESMRALCLTLVSSLGKLTLHH